MKESAFASAVRLLEDSLVLAGRMDSASWLVYLSGVAPFFALLLVESTDLAQNPFALERLPLAALALAVLYGWLHVCQSVFCARLHATLTETSAPLRACFAQAFALQPALAPAKLIVWPAALALLIPHATVTMFYQHSLLPAASKATLRSALSEARRDALYRQGQAVWMLLLILLLRAIVWINLFVLLVTLPSFWKMFTGQEGKFTRSPDLLLNPASFAALSILVYIALDPIVKAAVVLRRFARQSETSGLDLRLRISLLRRAAAAALLFCTLCLPFQLLRAAPSIVTPAHVGSAVTPARMRDAIQHVFHDPRDSWDLPVVTPRKPASNPLEAFVNSIADRLGKAWEALLSGIDALLEALRHALSNPKRSPEVHSPPVSRLDGWAVIGLFTILLTVMLFIAFRRRSKRLRPQSAAISILPAEPIDIENENLHAIDQPEAEWLKLAAQHRDSGNLRLALRAFYLSTLAALGRAGLITLARGKTNLEYFRELERRAKRRSAAFIPAFRSNLRLFEQSWYGAHPVTEQTLDEFERNSSLLRSHL
jgi:hypothetical protein